MTHQSKIKTFFFLFTLLAPISLFALGEALEIYSAPQALAMGKAITADASGFAALYHNPAGLATSTKKRWELNVVDMEGMIGGGTIGRAASSQTLGMNRLYGDLKAHPGTYAHLSATAVPSFAIRNFGLSLLATNRFSGVSDGTVLDTIARKDIGVVAGYARYFAGNVVKLGIAAKFLIRNEMKGQIPHSTLEALDDSTFDSQFKEGYGVGADAGMIITLPNKWLPTFGIAWLDVLNTRFGSSHFLNSQSSGTPDSIPQTVNVAFSVHPLLDKNIRSTLAVEYQHLEISNLPWRKHFHVGLQIETDRSFYFWLGANAFYPTAGIAYRVRGGVLEVGSYGEEIGEGADTKCDQRFFTRYTIGF